MNRKILLTGEPKAGKTTAFQKIASQIKERCIGFYTIELRNDNGDRIGFDFVTINLPVGNGPLAHVDLTQTPFKLGRYGVDITHLEKIIPEMRKFYNQGKIFLIDEIGTMEEFSEEFKKFTEEIFNSQEKVLATIKLESSPWRDHIKQDFDAPLYTIKPDNRDEIPAEILKHFV